MILTFDNENWFFDIIRTFFGAIDYVIYTLLSWIVEGIFNLSNLMVDPVFVKVIYNRIYVIVGIFMVFKLAFSFLQYIISPDSMSDKEKGVGKLIVRAITMLAILVILPVIFFNQDLVGAGKGPILNVLQTGLIKTIPKVILGISDEPAVGAGATENSVTLNANEYGDFMAIKMLTSFYYPEKCKRDASACTADATYIANFDEFLDTINQDDDDNPNVYDYQYMWPLTTVAGVVLVVIMLGMAVDIAIRTFKLVILQMMAPVPVMMYIDPKGSKDGAFNSWLKTFISTYVDIFVKLASIYLLLLLVSKMFSGDGTGLFAGGIAAGDDFMSRNFVRVFLIIGLFKFAKDAPKFIKDAMGMKDSGGGLFDGMKSLGAAAGLAGGALMGGISGFAGGISATKARVDNAKQNGKRGIGAGIAGAFSTMGSGLAGLGRGGHQGFTGAGKNGNLLKGFAAATAAQGALNKKKLEAAAAGSTWSGRMGARFDNAFGRTHDIDQNDEDIKNWGTINDKVKTIMDTAQDKGYKNGSLRIATAKEYTDISGHTVGRVGGRIGDHQLFKNMYENAVKNGDKSVTFHGTTFSMATAGSILKDFNDEVAKNYISNYTAGSNAVIDNAINEIAIAQNALSNDSLLIDSTTGKSRDFTDVKVFNENTGKDISTHIVSDKVRGKYTVEERQAHKFNKDAVKKSGK